MDIVKTYCVTLELHYIDINLVSFVKDTSNCQMTLLNQIKIIVSFCHLKKVFHTVIQ